MIVKGRIKLINETQTFDSGFSKREFVVTTQEQYPQDIKMELVKDKCSVLDTYKVDDLVEASINLRGNEYQGKYYVNIQAWKIDKVGTETTPIPEAIASSGDDDLLPF